MAVFGSMTYRSVVLGKTVTSPFAVFRRVRDGKITYAQFMEDSFATARSFRSGGTWAISANPDGSTVEV